MKSLRTFVFNKLRDKKYLNFSFNSPTCICVCVCVCIRVYIYIYTQSVSHLEDITAAGDFLGLNDQKSSYKHMSDFGQLRSYGHFLIPVHAPV